MTINKKITETSVRIGLVRFSYVHVFERKKPMDGKTEGKYSVSILIPKTDTDTIKLINEAVEAAKLKGKSEKWGGMIPGNVKSPLRDGDVEREDDEAYAGMYFINASSDRKPQVRVKDGGQIYEAIEDDDFYSGCWGAVTLNFFPYDASGNRGVGAGLNNLLKMKDGDKLSGGRSAEEDFGDLGDDCLS